MADTTRSEPPRLYIAHHQASQIDHTGVGEYQVTMSLRVEMVNAQKEIVHAQFLVDGTPQGYPQLLGDDGYCEQILVLAPATHPHIFVLLPDATLPPQSPNIGPRRNIVPVSSHNPSYAPQAHGRHR
jgi:hypothetical protein